MKKQHIFIFFFFSFLFCVQPSVLWGKKTPTHPIPRIKELKYGENEGLILRTFSINVPGFPHAYNPSMVAYDNGYVMVFRAEPACNKKYLPWPKSFLGIVSLDTSFTPVSKATLLDTGNEHSEDPRIFSTRQRAYILHSHVLSYSPGICSIALTGVDLENRKSSKCVDLQYKEGAVEKNWTPFVYTSKEGKEEVYIVYKFSPHRILKLNSGEDGNVSVAYENSYKSPLLKNWEQRWGLIRGGTPAIHLGKEYLSFFHSSFLHQGIIYYVFGVITFEDTPPFSIKKISSAPLLFKEMYEKPVLPEIWFYPRKRIRVIFPGGIASGVEEGKEVLYVLCGENDVAIKGIVFDKEALLTSLQKVE